MDNGDDDGSRRSRNVVDVGAMMRLWSKNWKLS